jgi:hypothetical protein
LEEHIYAGAFLQYAAAEKRVKLILPACYGKIILYEMRKENMGYG